MIISLFETVRLSVLFSPRNLYNSLKSIKERYLLYEGKKGKTDYGFMNKYINILTTEPEIRSIIYFHSMFTQDFFCGNAKYNMFAVLIPDGLDALTLSVK